MNAVVEHGKYTREQLLAMSGQMLSGNKDFLASLYINRSPSDKDENDLKVGVYSFVHKDEKIGLVQAKKPKKGDPENPVLFRPYYKGFRYVTYDSKSEKTTGRSIIFTDFGQEIIADNGLLKAGAKSDKLGPTEKTRCKILVFGTVSFDGVTAKGEDYKVVDYPVFLQLGGQNFLDYDKVFKEFAKTGKLSFQYDMKVTPNHVKDAIYNAKIEWANLTNEHPITEEVIKTLENFVEYVELENKRIETKWKRIIDKAGTQEERDDPIVADVADLTDDFQDDPT